LKGQDKKGEKTTIIILHFFCHVFTRIIADFLRWVYFCLNFGRFEIFRERGVNRGGGLVPYGTAPYPGDISSSFDWLWAWFLVVMKTVTFKSLALN
jgi:hypothetical protein